MRSNQYGGTLRALNGYPLSPGPALVEAVDHALRRVCHQLLNGTLRALLDPSRRLFPSCEALAAVQAMMTRLAVEADPCLTPKPFCGWMHLLFVFLNYSWCIHIDLEKSYCRHSWGTHRLQRGMCNRIGSTGVFQKPRIIPKGSECSSSSRAADGML